MSHFKLQAGSTFPAISVPLLKNEARVELGTPNAGYDWKLVIVYRGKHCPICTRYLQELNDVLPRLNQLGIDVIAVSADSHERAQMQMNIVKPQFPVAYSLNVEQMQQLGLYISNPRYAQETDKPFPEPGLYVINEKGNVQLVDIANAPFLRPSLERLVSGLGFIRNPENNYPIRGTFEQE